ncbi:MAG: DUF1631 family protein [Herminiimonas sp.]|nr:DUF1631 family protein [Herminiimonas sp.]
MRPKSAAPNDIAVDTPSLDDQSAFALEGFPAASPLLLAKLHEYQEIAARGQAIDGVMSSDQNQLFAVREGLGAQKTTPLERVTIDIVASLFSFILEDEQIPPILRVHIGRLQIPFLKAAMLAPDLLRQEDHPARQLLNRMGSLAIGVDASEPIGRALGDEIARLSGRILIEFNEDTEIFSTCLHELDNFIARQLRHADTETASSIEEIEQDEASARLLDDSSDALRLLLSPLPIDARIVDFVMLTWVRVLTSTMDGNGNGTGSDAGSSPATLSTRQACALLPNLLWSVQDKNADERSVLLRLLPGLIKDLKSGMEMIGLPADQSTQALDNLFDMHSRILRGTMAVDNGDRMSLEQFQQHFSVLPSQLDGMQADAGIDDTAALPARQPGIAGEEADLRPEHESDWLAAVKVGTSIERWAEVDYKPGRLVWASMNRTLFMFKMEMDSKPVVYSAASLTKALRESSVRLIEYASVFDRAVESLLIETENIEPRPA